MGAKGKSLLCRVIGDPRHVGIVRVWEIGGDYLSSHLSDISDQSSVIVVMGRERERGVRGNVVFQSTQYEVNTGRVIHENYKYQPVNTISNKKFL